MRYVSHASDLHSCESAVDAIDVTDVSIICESISTMLPSKSRFQ